MSPPKTNQRLYSRLVYFGMAIVATLVLLPAGNEYWELWQRSAQLNSLHRNQDNLANRQNSLNVQIEALEKTVQELETKTIVRGTSDSLQETLVGLVRIAGCQLRNVNVARIESRRWYRQDDPLDFTAPVGEESTRYELLTQTVNLSVVGSIETVQKCMQSLQAEPRFKHVGRLTLTRDDIDDAQVLMDIEILFFGFEQVDEESFDMET